MTNFYHVFLYSFINEPIYKEILENSANFNTRLCIERRMRLPFIDTQTGVAQNHSSLFMNKRQRMPGITPGQIYSYPRQRWRKKRRQYLSMNSRTYNRHHDLLDGESDMHSISQIENPALQDTDSKDSQLLPGEVSKVGCFVSLVRVDECIKVNTAILPLLRVILY